MVRIPRRLQAALGLMLLLWGRAREIEADPPAEGPAELVHDFFPGELEGVWTQPQFTQLGDVLFFAADDLDTGEGVWRTDGTPAGTRRIPVPGESGIGGSRILGVLGTRVLWTRNTGEILRPRALVSASRRGRGTILATFYPKDAVDPLAFAGGRFFFQDCTDKACPIWSTDGTVAGTAPVRILADRFPATGLDILTAFANRWLVFSSKEKLYAYDVPQDRVLPLLSKGAQGLWVSEIHPVGENLFFITVDEHGNRNRLWVSRLSAPRASQLFSDKSLSIAGWRDDPGRHPPRRRRAALGDRRHRRGHAGPVRRRARALPGAGPADSLRGGHLRIRHTPRDRTTDLAARRRPRHAGDPPAASGERALSESRGSGGRSRGDPIVRIRFERLVRARGGRLGREAAGL